MIFSKTELKVISQIAYGNKDISEIAKALNISASQIYRIAQKLSQKGIITLKESILQPEMKTHVNMLLKILSNARSLIIPLSGTGLQIFIALLEPKTTKEVQEEISLHKTTILKKIKQGRGISLLKIENKKYRVNERIWQDVRDYLLEQKRYEESIDNRVPVNSIIYYKNDKEIVFSNKGEIDAKLTAFSAYEKYGIKILGITYYYHLPKKHLIKKEVFLHSLYVVDKTADYRGRIYIGLFLAKFIKELSKIKHPIVDNLLKIFHGENVPGYPLLSEIRDRAEIYNIKV